MLINTFSRVRGCKINAQNVVDFLHANDKYNKKEKNPIHDPLKESKISLTRELKKLTQWNLKILKKEAGDFIRRGKDLSGSLA